MAARVSLLFLFAGFLLAQSTGPLYLKFFGGKLDAFAEAVVVDSIGNAYIAGNTMSAIKGTPSADFPVTEKAFFKHRGTGRQGFLVKLDPDGRTLFSTLLPTATAKAMALDRFGNIYITGEHLRESAATPGAFQTGSHAGGNDHYAGEAYVMKVDSTGAALVWATHLGGSRFEHAGGIAIDSKQRVYVTGWTTSPDFPLTANAWQKTISGRTDEDGDAFVTVFDPDGKRLVFSTLLGNSSNAWGLSITLDQHDVVYVVGNAREGFPTTRAAWRPQGAGAFVAKLDIEHATVLYATYLGVWETQAKGAIADDASNLYVTGYTDPKSFRATRGAYQQTSQAKTTAFVIKVNPSGTQPGFATMLGGTMDEGGMAIGIDNQKRVYVAGRTSSDDFPLTVKGLRHRSRAGEDVFLSVLDPTGSRLEFSTLVAGPGWEVPFALAVTGNGQAIVAGHTTSDWLLKPTIRTHQGEMGTTFVFKIVPP